MCHMSCVRVSAFFCSPSQVFPSVKFTAFVNFQLFPTLLAEFLAQLDMTPDQLDSFKEEMLNYSQKNLVKVTAYIEKVFAIKYKTDEVSHRVYHHSDGCADDVRDVPDRQPGRHDGALHGHVLCQHCRDCLFHGGLLFHENEN